MMTATLWTDPEPCMHGRTDHCPFCTSRSSDPDTSYEAAKQVTNSDSIRARIVELLAAHGAMSHDDMIDRFDRCGWPGTPSGIRTRCRELVAAGRVQRAETDGTTATGRRCATWELV